MPETISIRPATIEDLEPVLGLMIAQNMADYDSPMISRGRLRQIWESPRFNLVSDTWLVSTHDGRVIAYADVQCESDTQIHTSVFVAADQNGKGIELRLLQLVEARVSTGLVDRVVLTTRISDRNAVGISILEQAGYSLDLSFLVMEIVMHESPAKPAWAGGITVRLFRIGQDELPVYLADEEASEDKGYHQSMTFESWMDRMKLHGAAFDPTFWFIAWDGEQVAGVALNEPLRETSTGLVDHLGVRRQWRNKGIGRALLLHSLGEFYRRSTQRVRLCVDSKSLTNAPRIYERAGMKTIQRYHVYKKDMR